jgi:tagaturonate epimerase
MSDALQLGKYSIGVGDRFAHQARAQLQSCIEASKKGVEVIPVWNKSNREHRIVGSNPRATRVAADAAVAALHWKKPYHVDADHINLATVASFIDSCDFFTIDVADHIGQPTSPESVQSFVARHPELQTSLQLPGSTCLLPLTRNSVTSVATKYLAAAQEAARIYRQIAQQKGQSNFITEISMDETDSPQTPAELLTILAAIADEAIPLQTIAPKFSGRFNKGVDYQGDIANFAEEFSLDLAAIAFAVRHYALPANLKLSIHTGSDKFSIYPSIHRALELLGAGVHLKTAGTTWLEELCGLAESGGAGLQCAKQIYRQAYDHRAELSAPYAKVIDIDPEKLPPSAAVDGWSPAQFSGALHHNLASPFYNPSFRQLLHISFKFAAAMGSAYLDLLTANESLIAAKVTSNLFERHIRPVFIGN